MPPKLQPAVHQARTTRLRARADVNTQTEADVKSKPGSSRSGNLKDDEAFLMATGYGPIISGESGRGRAMNTLGTLWLGTRFSEEASAQWANWASKPQGATIWLRQEGGNIINVPDIVRTHGLPNGGVLIPTGGSGLLYDLNALVCSFAAQFRDDPPAPTIGDIHALIDAPEVQEFNKISNYPQLTSTSNVRVDQLGQILHLWGQRRNPPIHLRLGAIVEGVQEPTIPAVTETPGTRYLWIYSDGEMGVGTDTENKTIFYSGIRPKNAVSQAQASSSG